MKTEILCIVDRSGSMSSMKDETIGGFNGFLTDQKAIPDPANLTLVLFDYEYLIIHNAKDLADVPPMDELQYQPRGATALLDAIGRGVTEVKERIEKEMKAITDAGYTKPDMPKVFVMIITDGQENSSKEWNKTRINQLIEDCKKSGWQFMFMSADMNGINDAHSYGIDTNMAIGYANTGNAMKKAFVYSSNNAVQYRTSGTISSTVNDKSFLGDTDEEDVSK